MMDWFIQALSRGRRIEQHGKTWIALYYICESKNGGRLYLVVEEGAESPADVKVIETIEQDKK